MANLSNRMVAMYVICYTVTDSEFCPQSAFVFWPVLTLNRNYLSKQY